MRYNITIEETVADTFEIEANSKEEALEKARELYNNVEIVLEPGTLLETKFTIEE